MSDLRVPKIVRTDLFPTFVLGSAPYQVLAQLAPPFPLSAEPEVEMDAKGTLGREGHAVETGSPS